MGVDVYNLFNSDAILTCDTTWTIDNSATPAVEVNTWGQAQALLSPRFMRVQVQLDFSSPLR